MPFEHAHVCLCRNPINLLITRWSIPKYLDCELAFFFMSYTTVGRIRLSLLPVFYLCITKYPSRFISFRDFIRMYINMYTYASVREFHTYIYIIIYVYILYYIQLYIYMWLDLRLGSNISHAYIYNMILW